MASRGQLTQLIFGKWFNFKRVFFFVIAILFVKLWRKCAELKARCSIPPRLYGGRKIQEVLKSVPQLWSPQKIPLALASGDLQLILLGVQMLVQETFCPYKFDKEFLPVTIEGRYPDKVSLNATNDLQTCFWGTNALVTFRLV